MGKAYFRVSYTSLAEALNLPEDTEVLRVTEAPEHVERRFDIYVKHPDLPEPEEGQALTQAHPAFRMTRAGPPGQVGQAWVFEFLAWGVDKHG